jgi:hypothetical protein
VELELKTPWRDGTTHLVMSPLEFMQRLAALVPRPRLHLIRFHGVLAPSAKLRARVVPQGPAAQAPAATEATADAGCEAEAALGRPHRIGWARLLERVFDINRLHNEGIVAAPSRWCTWWRHHRVRACSGSATGRR